eukprot:g2369.t1
MAPLSVIILLAAFASRSFVSATLPAMAKPTTPFVVESCDKAGSGLSATQSAGLTSRGFTKCVFGAFNVLLAGTATYPDNYLLTGANTVAGILDQDQDGVADDPVVLAKLSFKQSSNPPVLQGGVTHAEESNGDTLDRAGFSYAYSLQTWKGDSAATNVKIITEEVFHCIHAEGFGRAYPAQFSTQDFTTSVACREMSAAECVTWRHPENTCPNPGTHTAPPLAGTCNEANCDCAEWFHQVALILAGVEPGWRSDLMPSSKAALEASLSTEFKTMMADARYHQLQAPLTYSYSATIGGGGTATTTGTTENSKLDTAASNLPSLCATILATVVACHIAPV